MSKSSPYKKRHTNGVWYIHWTENRVGKRVSTGTKVEAEADQFLAEWILTEGLVEDAVRGDLLLGDIWSVYDEKHIQRKVTGRYNAALAWKQMESTFSMVPVSGLTQDRIDEYVHRRTTGKLGRVVKPHTAAKELSYLMAAIRFCADERRKIIGPEMARKFDMPPAAEPRDRWLREDEVERLFAAAERQRRGPGLSRGERFLWLALETAARKEAILDLTWDRVDLETNVIVYDVPGRKKTKKRRAVVPISAALRPVLERAYRERENDLVMGNKGAVWATIQHIAIEAGFSDQKVERGQKPRATGISPHVLRHTAATHMARRGVPLWIIAKILGNTLAVTERTYAKHCPDDLREAVDMISGWRNGEAA